MKAIHYIVILVLIIGISFAAYYFLKKKKQALPEKSEPTESEPEKKPALKINPEVLGLQKQLNTFLTMFGRKLIKEDGIMGNETSEAIKYVQENKGKLPQNSDIKTEKGIIKINTNVVYNNLKSATEFIFTKTPLAITPQGALYNTIKALW